MDPNKLQIRGIRSGDEARDLDAKHATQSSPLTRHEWTEAEGTTDNLGLYDSFTDSLHFTNLQHDDAYPQPNYQHSYSQGGLASHGLPTAPPDTYPLSYGFGGSPYPTGGPQAQPYHSQPQHVEPSHLCGVPASYHANGIQHSLQQQANLTSTDIGLSHYLVGDTAVSTPSAQAQLQPAVEDPATDASSKKRKLDVAPPEEEPNMQREGLRIVRSYG